MHSVSKSPFQNIVNTGDHLVLLYDNASNITSTVVSYISNCLTNNQQCIYITGDSNTTLIINRLKQLDLFDRFVNTKQLVFLTADNTYSKNGQFNPEKMKDLLISYAKSAKDQGYDGLGISGEISSVLHFDKGFELINEYEWLINEHVFGKHPVSALCRYNMDKFNDDMIINIIQLHPYLIIDNQVHENPFYIPPVAYKENDIPKYQVETWLKNIVNFTNTKSSFHMRLESQRENFKMMKNELTDDIINAIVGMLELHNEYTKNHSVNVAKMAKKLAHEIGLSKELQTITYYTALIHDIGKIKVPNTILNKPGELTPEEYEIVKMHPEWGQQALSQTNNLDLIGQYIKHHHERYDGSGYPDKLKGDQIPLISRILSICDAYDAMIHERPYRKAFSHDYAVDELKKHANSQFDPQLIQPFIEKVL
jgi:HD-GYP domain-containing protein (c-di-GMP phosphodiesterase class II)